MNDYRIVTAGDSALVVEFAEAIDQAVNDRAVSLAHRLTATALDGVRDVVPTYRSVGVYFDPLRANVDSIVAEVKRRVAEPTGSAAEPTRAVIRIPVTYGGEAGPDLADVAAFGGISEEEVVRSHTSRVYRVYMLGFIPGFAYMGSVEPIIAAPRRTVPRVRVPAGSVGIAGSQTAVYPSETPGGWQLIGRTSLKLFDLSRANPFLLEPGDAVQFYSVEASQREAHPDPAANDGEAA
jgi:inhibitor of KinA